MNWWLWRLAPPDKAPGMYLTIRDHYTFLDTLNAHMALDAIEEARKITRKEEERRRKAKRK